MKLLCFIAGVKVWQTDLGHVVFMAPAMIDDDGSGDSHGDPDFQDDTSLRYNGHALDADLDPYIVLPPPVICAVEPFVLGCGALVTNTATGLSVSAVVGDVGPSRKIGEISIACAKAIGVPSSPTTGGESRPIISYVIFPGLPAVVDGRTYSLQPFKVA